MQPRANRTGSRGVTIPKKCINNQLTKLKVYRIVNNCNWGICIAPPTKRLRAHRRAIISLYPGVHRQTGTKMSSADDEKRGSIAAASTLSAASSMHAVRQRKKPVRQFVNTCMGRWGCQTTRNAVQIMLAHRWQISASPIYTLVKEDAKKNNSLQHGLNKCVIPSVLWHVTGWQNSKNICQVDQKFKCQSHSIKHDSDLPVLVRTRTTASNAACCMMLVCKSSINMSPPISACTPSQNTHALAKQQHLQL